MNEENGASLKSLEATVARQSAEIDALYEIVADLMVAHAMSNRDMQQLIALREYTQFAEQRVREGGTKRTPKEFFEARLAAFAAVLDKCHASDLPRRYWVRSAWEWLDHRRYSANQRLCRALERIADWQS